MAGLIPRLVIFFIEEGLPTVSAIIYIYIYIYISIPGGPELFSSRYDTRLELVRSDGSLSGEGCFRSQYAVPY